MQPMGFDECTSFTELPRLEGYRPGLLHAILVVTECLGRIPPLMLTPAWLAMVVISCWPWNGLCVSVATLSLFFTLLDGVSLALLPKLGRSFGPVTPPLLALTVLRVGITFLGGLLWRGLPALVGVAGIQVVIAGVSLYATWIEPFQIEVTHAKLRSSKLGDHPPLRLLHLSDLHVERITLRERKLLDLAEELDPDLIVMTGDYLNLSSVCDPDAHDDIRDLIHELCRRTSGPLYAITGSPPVDRRGVVPEIFDGLDVTWLLDEVTELDLDGHHIHLAGLRCSGERSQDAPRLRRLLGDLSDDVFTLLLYHSPDLMPEAVALELDLYLCGHTHGGQLRLPFFGALVSSSAFWKRYEMGRYSESDTTLYVSRGLGVEGMGAPRARFLAPPELILWTISAD
jgi:hypothetical protein